jgi:hypothetical protein
MIRDGWHLILTYLDNKHASVSELSAPVGPWKFSFGYGSRRSTSAIPQPQGKRTLPAAADVNRDAHQLGMKIAQRIGSVVGRARLGYVKLYDLLAVRLFNARNLPEVAACGPDPRYLEREREPGKFPVESGIPAIT